MMDKSELRISIKQKRQELSEEDVQIISQKMCVQIFTQNWYKQAKTIHCFASIRENNEPDTSALLNRILEDGKTLVMSRVSGKIDLRHFVVRNLDNLKKSEWNIPEPQSGKEVSPEELDIVIVPLLAADKIGNRLGYGAGYYDHFLHQTKALKAGLCPDAFLCDEIPVEEHDVPLDVVITESKIIGINLPEKS